MLQDILHEPWRSSSRSTKSCKMSTNSNLSKVLAEIRPRIISLGIILGLSAIMFVIIELLPFSEDVKSTLSLFISPVVCIPIASLYVIKNSKSDLQLFLKPQMPLKGYISVLCCVGIMVLMSALTKIVRIHFGIGSETYDFEHISIVILFFLLCVITPVSEEVYYRFALSSLSNDKNDIIDIFSVIAFSVSHFSLINAPFYIVLSALSLKIDRRYQSVIPSIMLHAIMNLISFFIYCKNTVY